MPPPPDRRPIADQPTQLTPATGYLPARTPAPEAAASQQPTRITTTPPGSDATRATAPATMLRGPGVEDFSGQVWGDFQFGALLGRGGMGAVYRGRQVSLDRPVAIKVLPAHLGGDEGFRARFELEAKAVAQINSPHVIQVYGAGVHDGHHFFAMEFVEGSDLSRIIRGGPRVGHAQALDFVTQAARGLAAAGELGIVHRDIKPGNMMVTAKGRLKLMDFGLVKLASEGGHHLTQTGTVMGTVSYFSPEQGRGESCDTRTDLYALGVVFYELLTGRLPFTGSDATSVIYQHIHEAPKPPRELDPSIPEDYQAVVLKCMQKRADDRYAGAAELLADLERLVRGEAPAIGPGELTMLRQGALLTRSEIFRRERRGRGRLPLLAGAAAALLAGGGAAAWWLTRPAPAAAAPAGPATAAAMAVQPAATAAGVAAATPAAAAGPDQRALLGQLVADRRWDEARALVRRMRAEQPGERHWIDAGPAIDLAEAEDAAARSRRALADGDLDAAQAALLHARELAPEAATVLAVGGEVDRARAARKQRAAALAEVEAHLAAGRAAEAEALLDALAKADAGGAPDPQVAGLLARARSARQDRDQALAEARRQLEAGGAALARRDLPAAQAAFAAAQAVPDTAAAAGEGLARVEAQRAAVARERQRLEAAIQARDLDQAGQALAALKELLPDGHESLARAEDDLAQARARAEAARRAAEELEARRVAGARALLDACDDPRRTVPELERELAAFLAEAGERPEKPLLERRLDDRRQREEVAALLPRLDRAVLAGDAAAIAAVVADRSFAAGLAELKRYEGLVFAARLASFSREGAAARAELAVRHALRVYPERELRFACELARDPAAGWRITAARLLPATSAPVR